MCVIWRGGGVEVQGEDGAALRSASACAVQVIGLGWPNYWKVMWNKFDCCLLVTGVVDMALTLAIGEQPHRAGLAGCVQDTTLQTALLGPGEPPATRVHGAGLVGCKPSTLYTLKPRPEPCLCRPRPLQAPAWPAS